MKYVIRKYNIFFYSNFKYKRTTYSLIFFSKDQSDKWSLGLFQNEHSSDQVIILINEFTLPKDQRYHQLHLSNSRPILYFVLMTHCFASHSS